MAGFCKYCGRSLMEGEICHCREGAAGNTLGQMVKIPKAIGIVNIVAGALMLFIGLTDIDYDWGIVALAAGVGFLVIGILELVKKKIKVVGILQVIFGSVSVLAGIACDLDYDWGYISILIGVAIFVAGIIRIMKKSIKISSVIEIVFAGILLLVACMDLDYDWGMTALAASIGLLVSGIVFLVGNRAKS